MPVRLGQSLRGTLTECDVALLLVVNGLEEAAHGQLGHAQDRPEDSGQGVLIHAAVLRVPEHLQAGPCWSGQQVAKAMPVPSGPTTWPLSVHPLLVLCTTSSKGERPLDLSPDTVSGSESGLCDAGVPLLDGDVHSLVWGWHPLWRPRPVTPRAG